MFNQRITRTLAAALLLGAGAIGTACDSDSDPDEVSGTVESLKGGIPANSVDGGKPKKDKDKDKDKKDGGSDRDAETDEDADVDEDVDAEVDAGTNTDAGPDGGSTT